MVKHRAHECHECHKLTATPQQHVEFESIPYKQNGYVGTTFIPYDKVFKGVKETKIWLRGLCYAIMQMEEMKLNLGPAKGKDFATAFGPWLVTTDELNDYKIESNTGTRYDLNMTARHNGMVVSEGNLKDMHFTFADIIERCSYGVELIPGDIIGSGTVGAGCFLELNGTKKREAAEKGEEFEPVWLKQGDEIELEITGLGTLKNKIVLSDNNVGLKYR